MEDKALASGVMWAPSCYINSGCFKDCGHLAASGSNKRPHREKEKIVEQRMQWPSEKGLVAALKKPSSSVVAE